MEPQTPEARIMGQSDRAIDQALEIIGQVIDTAFDTQSAAGTDHAFDLIQKLEQQELSPEQSALLHYYRSNAWENRLHEGRRTDSRTKLLGTQPLRSRSCGHTPLLCLE